MAHAKKVDKHACSALKEAHIQSGRDTQIRISHNPWRRNTPFRNFIKQSCLNEGYDI